MRIEGHVLPARELVPRFRQAHGAEIIPAEAQQFDGKRFDRASQAAPLQILGRLWRGGRGPTETMLVFPAAAAGTRFVSAGIHAVLPRFVGAAHYGTDDYAVTCGR